MRDSVKNAYTAFTTKFEGNVPFMYQDVKGLVTAGIGNLMNSVAAAQALPWRTSSGALASKGEIATAWNAVKKRTDLNQKGGMAYSGVTSLRLDKAGIDQLVQGKLRENEVILRKRFPSFDSWPADGQLALLSMAWAAGANFKSPKLEAAVNQLVPDFLTAAKESSFSTVGNPGLVPRNKANVELFTNAANALKNNLNIDKLHWPEVIPTIVKGGIGVVGLSAIGVGAYFAYKKFGA